MVYGLTVILDNSTLNNPAVANANSCIVEIEHQQLNTNTLTINLDKLDGNDKQAVNQLLNDVNANSLPVILFLETTDQSSLPTVITRMTKNMTCERIKGLMLKILNKNFTGLQSNEEPGDSQIFNGNGNGSGFFNFSFGKLFWGIVAVGAGYKTLDSDTRLGQIGFGAVGTYATIKYLK